MYRLVRSQDLDHNQPVVFVRISRGGAKRRAPSPTARTARGSGSRPGHGRGTRATPGSRAAAGIEGCHRTRSYPWLRSAARIEAGARACSPVQEEFPSARRPGKIAAAMRDRDDAPSLADLAPKFDAFPGFGARDFAAFEKQKQRDSDFNGERLLVKRKLAALGKEIAPALAAAGLDLEARTSLSHPYTYNAFRVDSMWVYFGRSEAAKKAIKKKLGAELGKDVDPTYQGAILLVEIDERRVACGFKIHPAAWWDGQNLARRVKSGDAAAAELTRILNALPAGYAMTIGDWRRRYEAGKLYPDDIRNYFQYYRPGEVWLHLLHETPREAAIAAGPVLARDLGPRLAALAPLYRFTAWTPENDFVLGR